MMTRPTRTYVPTSEWLTLDWHHACIAAGCLCIQHCTRCGRWRHPPRRCCPDCFSDSYEFRPVAGTGSIRSLAVSHRSLDPGWHDLAPYAVLLVELAEGPSVLAAAEEQPSRLALGRAVDLTIDPRSDDFVLLWANPR
jgi:uncharacterized OB-fold protein